MSTSFQKSVWGALKLIPIGKVSTYREVARYIGKPYAVRAVGSAIGKKPNAPSVPCHRVVLSDGRVGNYSAFSGVVSKISLLENEGVFVSEDRVLDFERKVYRFCNHEIIG